MTKSSLFYSLFFLVILASCATTLTKQGARVVEADTNMIRGCSFVGSFTATDQSGFDVAQRLGNVKTKIKNQAAMAGATHILMENVSSGGMFNNAPILSGKGYKCP